MSFFSAEKTEHHCVLPGHGPCDGPRRGALYEGPLPIVLLYLGWVLESRTPSSLRADPIVGIGHLEILVVILVDHHHFPLQETVHSEFPHLSEYLRLFPPLHLYLVSRLLDRLLQVRDMVLVFTELSVEFWQRVACFERIPVGVECVGDIDVNVQLSLRDAGRSMNSRHYAVEEDVDGSSSMG